LLLGDIRECCLLNVRPLGIVVTHHQLSTHFTEFLAIL
jgi:hypothetical protein